MVACADLKNIANSATIGTCSMDITSVTMPGRSSPVPRPEFQISADICEEFLCSLIGAHFSREVCNDRRHEHPASTQPQIEHVISLVTMKWDSKNTSSSARTNLIAVIGNDRLKDKSKLETVEGVDR